jgi:hypothetical protein
MGEPWAGILEITRCDHLRGNNPGKLQRRGQYMEIRMNRIHRVHGATLKSLPPTGWKGGAYVYYVSCVPTWAGPPNISMHFNLGNYYIAYIRSN